MVFSYPEHKLFVGMLPKNVTEVELSDLFSQYGDLKDLQILRGSQQTSKGTCFFISNFKYKNEQSYISYSLEFIFGLLLSNA